MYHHGTGPSPITPTEKCVTAGSPWLYQVSFSRRESVLRQSISAGQCIAFASQSQFWGHLRLVLILTVTSWPTLYNMPFAGTSSTAAKTYCKTFRNQDSMLLPPVWARLAPPRNAPRCFPFGSSSCLLSCRDFQFNLRRITWHAGPCEQDSGWCAFQGQLCCQVRSGYRHGAGPITGVHVY